MSTSATDQLGHHASKTAAVYVLLSILTALFGAVYERFSHEVYSYSMLYAFAFPLIGGVAPFQRMTLKPPRHYPDRLCRQMYHSGIAALTVGSIVRGILEIYGTTNRLTVIYWWLGMGLIVSSVILHHTRVRCGNAKASPKTGR